MTSTTGAYVQPPMGAPLNGQLSAPIAQYTTPSLGLPGQQWQGGRGVCTLSAPGVGTLQFRTNPNEITWDYELITHIEQTYGGRVIQILGAKIDNLTVKVDCGQGGWPYAMYVVQFMRDLMVTQRNGIPATFTYTTRNWQLKVFALNVPFHDSVQETIRELTLNFKIQEDVSGIQIASAIADALSALQDGIGYLGSLTFGSGSGSYQNEGAGGGPATALQNTASGLLPTALTGPAATGIPGADLLGGALGGFFGGLF